MNSFRMKLRRAFPLALILCLSLTVLPFALADGSATPVTTTPDATIVTPGGDSSSETAPPDITPGDVAPGDVAPGGASVSPATTGDAALVTTGDAALANGIYDPNPTPGPDDLVMTIGNLDTTGHGPNIQSMQSVFGNALAIFKHENPGKDWQDVTWLKVEGDAKNMMVADWEWLKSKCLLTANNYRYTEPNADHPRHDLSFADPGDHLRVLDLSALSNVVLLSSAMPPNAGSYDVTPVEKPDKVQILLPENLKTIDDYAFYHCSSMVLPATEFPASMSPPKPAIPGVGPTIGDHAFDGCGAAFPNLTTLPTNAYLSQSSFRAAAFLS